VGSGDDVTARVLLALPDVDFDPTEAAVPWKALMDAGHEVVFATPSGQPSACDPDMLTGVLFGGVKITRANAPVYEAMTQDAAFGAPLTYEAIDPATFDAIVLPGGHAQGMKPYLESEALQAVVAAFFVADKPVAAICHGTIVLARTKGPDGASVIAGRRMTCLPRTMEWSAWIATVATRGNYFRTYPEWVQSEVARFGGMVETGPLVPTYGNPCTVRDGKLLTARWPGDASKFAAELVAMLAEA
jgi:putative intracellular protease/amidase